RLERCLEAETQWNRYNQYKNSTIFATMPTAGHDLFPEVVKIIDNYLTEAVNNIVKFEMAQYINGNKHNVISEEPEETDDSYSDNKALDNQDIDIQVPQNIENPNCVIGRGRPSKRHYKSSVETEQK
ncbi:10190_t:CDS:2, partial [Gigaspora rosea]